MSSNTESKSHGEKSVAILHDRFPGIGGGEKFAIEAARVLDAPIYTMYVAGSTDIPRDVEIRTLQQEKYTEGITSRFLEWKNEGMNPLETLAVTLDMTDADEGLTEYDVILESAPLSKNYVPTTDQRVIHYPHSPPRWLYDLYRDRMSSFQYPGVRMIIKAYAKVWRSLDKEANDYVDVFVANSELIRDRIKRYYGEDSEVIYPPVTGNWRNNGDEGYFVTWSRLAPEKRMDLIVKAFTRLDERLIVAGDGQQRETLERMAAGHQNIEIRGFVEDIESLVAKSTAVIYAPKQEDFGLVGAEALSAGKPLLGVDEGFTKYQATSETGLRFEPTAESIRDAVRNFNADEYNSDTIQEFAGRYDYRQFERSIQALVDREVE